MDAVLRAVAVYGALLVILRLSGKRTLSEMTTFNFVLLLIISEATQQALLGQDFSVTMAVLVILTLVALDRVSDALRYKFPLFDRISNSEPVLIVNHGEPLEEVMRREHISVEEILSAARETQGIGRLDQIKYAVLETSGGISVVPQEQPAEAQ
ncbi:MAG: DUF421 domain-containing protein [Actinomycetales bacterium]